MLYLSSTLYHALTNGRAKRVFRVLDHASIYLLIAGAHTPFTPVTLRGVWGWVAVVAIRRLWQARPWQGFLLMLAGGLLCTAGVVFFAGRWKYSHTVWHLFVLAGSVCHFQAVCQYVLRG